MYSPRKAIALAKARQIGMDLQIKEADEIDVERIAFYYKVAVRYQPMDGMDGRIVRNGDRATITVRDSIDYWPQKRFVIAHELGHFFLHPTTKQLDTVTAAETRDWSEKQHFEEYEANLFAAELLMPTAVFTPKIADFEPNFDELKKLAKEFQTTLTATAVQYVLTTKEDCALVSCAGRDRKWFICRDTFPPFLKDNRCHGHSCAAKVGPYKLEDRSQLIEAGWWLEGFYNEHKAYITEDARYFPKLQRSLSLLWLHDEI